MRFGLVVASPDGHGGPSSPPQLRAPPPHLDRPAGAIDGHEALAPRVEAPGEIDAADKPPAGGDEDRRRVLDADVLQRLQSGGEDAGNRTEEESDDVERMTAVVDDHPASCERAAGVPAL